MIPAAKLFSANITADDYREMIARGEFILETFAENADHVAFLVDGYVAGPTAITTARRHFPNQYLHYHRAGHGAVTSPQTQRGYTAFVLAKMSRLQGASGIHVGTMSHGKMEGEEDDTQYCLHDRARQCGRSLLPPGMGRHAADHADRFRRNECPAPARLF